MTTRDLSSEVYDLVASEFIFSGQVCPGELLPSETRLATHYGVSRVTIRVALRMLQDAHLIRIRNGIGSVVLPRPDVVVEGLDQLCSLETYARERSQRIATVDVTWSQEGATEEIAAKLELPHGATVCLVHRAKVAGDVRVAWGIEAVPADILSLEALKAEYVGSAMDVLLAHTELGVEYADAELEPAAAPPDVAERLGVEPGTVCQILEQVMFAGGRPVQWGRAWLLPAYYRLQVRRRPKASPKK